MESRRRLLDCHRLRIQVSEEDQQVNFDITQVPKGGPQVENITLI